MASCCWPAFYSNSSMNIIARRSSSSINALDWRPNSSRILFASTLSTQLISPSNCSKFAAKFPCQEGPSSAGKETIASFASMGGICLPQTAFPPHDQCHATNCSSKALYPFVRADSCADGVLGALQGQESQACAPWEALRFLFCGLLTPTS